MSPIVESAPAKINLALHVRRRRADGYHEIETLFAFCRDGDGIAVGRAGDMRLTITGPFSADLEADDGNLVLRAARCFNAAFGRNDAYAITLDKHLPVASGIGGGSADAAATLRVLAKMHGARTEDPRLIACAGSLGSDVPACLLGRTALGSGRGEQLEVLDGLAGIPVLLVNPRVAVSTAKVFAGWDGVDRGAMGRGAPLTIARDGRNDLEAPARGIASAIGDVLAWLGAQPGATMPRMSGSGATCFALFADAAARDLAARAAPAGWWTFATELA